MGSIFAIAKRDLKSFFTSMRGPIVLFILILIAGIFFKILIGTFMSMKMRAMQMGGTGGPSVEELISALFQNIHFLLILIVPAVTMSCFAEERKAQTDRLFKSAPVTALQVVLGKYLSCFLLMATALVCLFVYPAYLYIYGNPEFGVIFSSFLGFILLIAAQLSFGVWISSMTSNQIVAFIVTMGGLFLLFILQWAAPQIVDAGLLQDVFKYLAFTEHFNGFLKGLVSVQNVTYFVLFISTFLFFTNVSLDSQRWR